MVPEQEQALAREGTPATESELLRAMLASQHRQEELLQQILQALQPAPKDRKK